MKNWNDLSEDEIRDVINTFNSDKQEDYNDYSKRQPTVFDKYDVECYEEFYMDNPNESFIQYDFSNGSIIARIDDVDYGA